jgi:hypothetical protein
MPRANVSAALISSQYKGEPKKPLPSTIGSIYLRKFSKDLAITKCPITSTVQSTP